MAVTSGDDSITWSLADAGMDLFERAGLAGLYMALEAARDQGHDLSPILLDECKLEADYVKVKWRGPAREAFVKLMEWAWQVRDGVFYFPAIHDDRARFNWWERLPSHNGLMGTCFQNNKVQPRGAVIKRVVRVSEDVELNYDYLPVERLKPHRDVTCLFGRGRGFRASPVMLSSWVHPGHTSRYPSDGRGVNWKEKPWRGSADRALLLMLWPTVALFLRLQGEGGNWVAVVPDFHDLVDFSAVRPRLYATPDSVDVAAMGDAGLQFVASYTTNDLRRDTRASCQVVAIGKASYFHKMSSTRKAILEVGDRGWLKLSRSVARRYRLLQQNYPNQYHMVRLRDGEQAAGGGWYRLPTGRGRISDNLVTGRPWYRDLFVPGPWDDQEFDRQRHREDRGTSADRVWFNALTGSRGNQERLINLIAEDDMWGSDQDAIEERQFVDAFWEMLTGLFRREADAARRGGSRDVRARWANRKEQIRRELAQAKTVIPFRQAVASLLAEARGPKPLLEEHRVAVWRLINHRDHWQKGRDLALLALATHRFKKAQQATSSSTPSPSQATIQ